jgi:S1-C subfamily serine protease
MQRSAMAVLLLLCAVLGDAGYSALGQQVARQGPRSVARKGVVIKSPVARRSNVARGSGGLVRQGKALPADDWTFRPTVIIRRGTSQGSGTIIASVDGETLVLTAAHVVQNPAPIFVELHRYNLGVERKPASGQWPRVVAATLVADDPAADLAVLRIAKMVALPYVARLFSSQPEPPPGAVVTSVGIDLGVKLGGWTTLLLQTRRFELNDNGVARSFLITLHPPEHGRSGGGLFLSSGELAGVCVGHTELDEGHTVGVFSAPEGIRQLLDQSGLTKVVALSETRRARGPGQPDSSPSTPRPDEPPVVTPTRSLDANRAPD